MAEHIAKTSFVMKRKGGLTFRSQVNIFFVLLFVIMISGSLSLFRLMNFTISEREFLGVSFTRSLKTLNCKRAAISPSWFSQTQSWNGLTSYESYLTGIESQPLTFLDPVSCLMSSTSFQGASSIREAGQSDTSGSSNRLRQLTMGIIDAATIITGIPTKRFCLTELRKRDLSVYNTDSYSPIHHALMKLSLKQYVSSEFLPGVLTSGTIVNGVRHEDLQVTSFKDNSFDIVISTEVFEHIPHPYKAFKEVYRILKPGGAHVFTVPYAANSKRDVNMSFISDEGKVMNGPGEPPDLIPPHYHGDSLRKEGIIVFTIFTPEMLKKLCAIGFNVETTMIQNAAYGIVGQESLVFTAWK